MLMSPTVTQHLVTTIIVAYVAVFFLYGYASLRRRRHAVADGSEKSPVTFGGIWSGTGQVVRLGCGMALPVLLLSTFISIAGRERTGVVESSELFTVAPRAESTVTFLADGSRVRKGDIVARFASEPKSRP